MKGRVAVIGAGIAGIHVAATLARDSWHVVLVDEAENICSGASGNLAGAFHAHVSRDDAPLSRLSRHGIAATLASLQQLTEAGLLRYGTHWAINGHYQICDSEEDEVRTRQTAQLLPHLQGELQWCDAASIASDLGIFPMRGGLYFPKAGWVRPRAWCEALLTNLDIERMFSARVDCLQAGLDGGCNLTLSTGKTLQVDRAVIAAAHSSLALLPQPCVQSRSVKGQVSLVEAPGGLGKVVSGAAYAIEPQAGQWLIGATYERPALDTEVTQVAHEQNMERLRAAFPALPGLKVLGGRSSIRTMWPDRMPAIGPGISSTGACLNDVWFATGYGSRGLTWAALGAQLIAAMWAGHPPPLPQDLVAAVLPGRFFSRASNSKPTLPSLPKTR